MPQKDGTGPRGKGPKTGRQQGNCQGAKSKQNAAVPMKKRIRQKRRFNNS